MSFFFFFFNLVAILLSLLVTNANGAANTSIAVKPKLHPSEVKALRQIALKLGKKDWDFSVDPCTGGGNFTVPDRPKGFESAVSCDCSFANNTLCRINSILIKAENLTGILPPEFSQLIYLQRLDLSRNVLNGGIPKEWANMQLQGLSLMANRLSGPFPMALTKITTLTNLSMEGNKFYGPIPAEIGNLVHMERLILSANKFTGVLPASLGQLTNLTDLRISSNNFSGKVPDFLKKLTKLDKLHIQGSLLEGPIPPGISKLTSLTDLRISDLRGNGSSFPDLSGMKSMKTLILRNCSIYGKIPDNIGEMEKLKLLDLSFNKLRGEIPKSFENFQKVDFIYLTGNMLSGSIPSWILTRNKNADISYNNFTVVSSGPTQCQGNINAVESYSSLVTNKPNIDSCLKKNFPCTSKGKYRSELHINCGGKEVILNNTKFESDPEPKGASMLYLSQTNWAFSSTGNFLDNNILADNYIANNVTKLINIPNHNLELYTKARLSPLSLKYYGLCMYNGDYTVNLHFVEIVYTEDNTFNSLGERIFNVFIQGKMVLEEFNIEKAAGGAGKLVIKTFKTSVINNTLEIHLYWAGRGTTGIPDRGFYGPLISAISVTPNFVPPEDHKNFPLLVTIGIPILAFFIVLFSACICWTRWRKTSMYNKELRALDLQVGSFTLRQIKTATKNFDYANKLGEGGFGSVYKGLLADGTIIAVKQLSSKSKQGNREFVNEIGMISALQHPNLVKLYGCCSEGNQLCLVYEYMENNCLSRAIFGSEEKLRIKLDWDTRKKICLGIARGLAYLHEESTIKIVHRDIKASNILLDKDLNAKISDFGLAKLNEEGHTHISTRVAGTIGYMAPEYAMRGYLTDKADVYSFGVVALETISGKSNTNYRPKEECVYLLDWACVLQERGTLLDLIDPDLGENYSKEEAHLMLNIALLCTNASPTLRPSMTKVVNLLEGRAQLQPLLCDLSQATTSANGFGARRSFWQINPSESQSLTLHESCTDSTESLTETEPLVIQG